MRSSLTTRVVLVYLGLRAISWVLLVLASKDQGVMPDWTGPTVEPIDMTVLWDGSWYRQVALHGYPIPLPLDPTSGHVAQNAWAFYPLFPLVSRMLMSVTGLGFPAVGSTLSLVCGLGAAVVMAGLLAERLGQRAALATVAVWAAFPAAVSLQLAFTESMAMLLLCGALWALARRAWLPAAGLALLLGLTRPIAAPLAVVVAVALLLRWRGRHRNPIGRPELVSGAAALAATCLAGTAATAQAAATAPSITVGQATTGHVGQGFAGFSYEKDRVGAGMFDAADTDLVRLWRDFLDAPRGFLRAL